MKSWLRFAGVGQAAVVLSLTACGAYGAQDISPATAQKLLDYMRPWTSPAPGDPVVLYGFNCSKDPDSRTPPGWIYHLEGGSTTMKPFGTKDARPARYFFGSRPKSNRSSRGSVLSRTAGSGWSGSGRNGCVRCRRVTARFWMSRSSGAWHTGVLCI